MSTAQRRAREKAQRREAILSAARDVFFEDGFKLATIEDVAARAEVSKGTIYLYFDSKDVLLSHLLIAGLEELVADLTTAYGPELALTSEERLRRLAQTYFAFFRDNPQYSGVLIALDRGPFEFTIPPALFEEALARSLAAYQLVIQTLQEGMDEGVIGTIEPSQAAALLWASLNGVLVLLGHLLRREMVGSDLEMLYWTTFDVLLRGLRKRAETQEEKSEQ